MRLRFRKRKGGAEVALHPTVVAEDGLPTVFGWERDGPGARLTEGWGGGGSASGGWCGGRLLPAVFGRGAAAPLPVHG